MSEPSALPGQREETAPARRDLLGLRFPFLFLMLAFSAASMWRMESVAGRKAAMDVGK